MDDLLKKEIGENEEKHKQYLKSYRFGEFLKDMRKNAAEHGKNPTPLTGKSSFALFGLVVVSYLLTFKIWAAILVFIVINIILTSVGKKMYKQNGAKLEELAPICRHSLEEYSAKRYEEYGICDARTITDIVYKLNLDSYYDLVDPDISELPRYGAVCFDDGVIIRNHYLDATMRKTFGNINFYQLENENERTLFEEQKRELASCINDKISSLDFNKKFGIVFRDSSSELLCMKYLSPSMQLNMIRADKIRNFSSIHIEGKYLSMLTGKTVDLPTDFYIYDKKPLMEYYNEVDTYCKKMRKMADEVYADFQGIDFMRGSSI